MKITAIILCLPLLAMLHAPAVSGATQDSANQQAGDSSTATKGNGADSLQPSKIDPAKEAAIRQLIEMSGTAALVNQVMDKMQETIKPELMSALPPGDYREKLVDLFFERFRSKADVRQLQDLSVQVYDKYFSEEDVKGLIQFYSTPLGQKTLSVLPKLTVDMQSEGMKWGQGLGRQAMIEVLTEHPELAKALADAKKNVPAR